MVGNERELLGELARAEEYRDNLLACIEREHGTGASSDDLGLLYLQLQDAEKILGWLRRRFTAMNQPNPLTELFRVMRNMGREMARLGRQLVEAQERAVANPAFYQAMADVQARTERVVRSQIAPVDVSYNRWVRQRLSGRSVR